MKALFFTISSVALMLLSVYALSLGQLNIYQFVTVMLFNALIGSIGVYESTKL